MSENSPAGQEDKPQALRQARQQVEDGLESATEYLRNNPWIGVLGGVVIGGILIGLSRSPKPEPTNLEKLRDLLEEAYAKLPTKKEAKSALNCLLTKLHIPS